jgi:hypothetical protein
MICATLWAVELPLRMLHMYDLWHKPWTICMICALNTSHALRNASQLWPMLPYPLDNLLDTRIKTWNFACFTLTFARSYTTSSSTFILSVVCPFALQQCWITKLKFESLKRKLKFVQLVVLSMCLATSCVFLLQSSTWRTKYEEVEERP